MFIKFISMLQEHFKTAYIPLFVVKFAITKLIGTVVMANFTTKSGI